MANEKVECPECDGDGLAWTLDGPLNEDCPRCDGEGEVDGEKTGKEN